MGFLRMGTYSWSAFKQAMIDNDMRTARNMINVGLTSWFKGVGTSRWGQAGRIGLTGTGLLAGSAPFRRNRRY